MAEPELCNQHRNFIYQGPSCVICATDRTVDAGIQMRAETYTQQEVDAIMAAHNQHADERVANAQFFLARKLIAIVEVQKLTDINFDTNKGIDIAISAIRAKCAELGVKVDG